MKEFPKTRSTLRPEPIVIDEYSVWVASNITPVSEKAVDDITLDFEGYEYDLIQYEKDEYIQLVADKNAELENQMESTQEVIDFLLFGAE